MSSRCADHLSEYSSVRYSEARTRYRRKSQRTRCSQAALANSRSHRWRTSRPHALTLRVRTCGSWVCWSLACAPRLVHYCIAATVGTRVRPRMSRPSQCRPGTQIGRPPGGLKKPGRIRLSRRAVLERTAQRSAFVILSGFSSRLPSHTSRTSSPGSRSRLNAGIRLLPEPVSHQTGAPAW
jgi:hypothetical protein